MEVFELIFVESMVSFWIAFSASLRDGYSPCTWKRNRGRAL